LYLQQAHSQILPHSAPSEASPKNNDKTLIEFVPSADNEAKLFAKSFIDLVDREREEIIKQQQIEEENKINRETIDPYNPFPYKPGPQPNSANSDYNNEVVFDEYIDSGYLQELMYQKQANQRREMCFPGLASCNCCHGHVYACKGEMCRNLEACQCYLPDIQINTLPAKQGEVCFPESASCECCHGHMFACNGKVCGKLGVCDCYSPDIEYSNLPAQQYFPDSASCECCHGHVYACIGEVCRNLDACQCYEPDIQVNTLPAKQGEIRFSESVSYYSEYMQVSNLPAQQRELYFPGSASCECCQGHVYSCNGAVCRNLEACHCYAADFGDEQGNM